MSKYARRVDANHTEIASALRAAGAVVVDTSRFGEGVPDLWVSSRNFTGWLEVKDGMKPPSARQLTKAEQRFFDLANIYTKHAHIVLSAEQALQLVFRK